MQGTRVGSGSGTLPERAIGASHSLPFLPASNISSTTPWYVLRWCSALVKLLVVFPDAVGAPRRLTQAVTPGTELRTKLGGVGQLSTRHARRAPRRKEGAMLPAGGGASLVGIWV